MGFPSRVASILANRPIEDHDHEDAEIRRDEMRRQGREQALRYKYTLSSRICVCSSLDQCSHHACRITLPAY